jgi:hypothetical protein
MMNAMCGIERTAAAVKTTGQASPEGRNGPQKQSVSGAMHLFQKIQ